MNEHNENFKKIENIRKYYIDVTEWRNTRTELKNAIEGFKSD